MNTGTSSTEVEVVLFAHLRFEQRIDTPSAIDPGGNTRGFEGRCRW